MKKKSRYSEPKLGANLHRGRAGVASQPEKTKPRSAGTKLKGFLGVSPKKPERDTPIVQAKKGGNPGAQARRSQARVQRLNGVRI